MSSAAARQRTPFRPPFKAGSRRTKTRPPLGSGAGSVSSKPVFTAAESPALPAGLERLALDLISHGPEQLNQIWACVGARHMPHLVYRARAVLLQDTEPMGSGAPITEIHHTLHDTHPRAVPT